MSSVSNNEIESQLKTGYLYPDTVFLKYYQFPEFILNVPVSQTARILYMVLYDRARISQKNNWVDEFGRVYLFYPIAKLAARTGRKDTAVKRGLNELLKAGLLEKKRSGGCGRPNIMYVKEPSDNDLVKRSKSDDLAGRKRSTSNINRVNNNNQTIGGSFRPVLQSTDRQNNTSAFQDYSYDEEDSL